MINQFSLDAVEEAKFTGSFIKPLYDTYCFSNIPQTIKNLLLERNKKGLPDTVLGDFPQSYDNVVVLLIDGFGWKFFERYSHKYPFLKRFLDKGVVSKLTAQFPSTTPAELTTINTGMSVGEHGVYEWVYYEPKLDTLISPLLFSFAGKRVRNTLLTAGIDPKTLFPTKTLYSELKQKNISSYAFLNADYAISPYNDTLLRDAEIFPYHTVEDGITLLSDLLIKNKEKGYYYFYFGGIDSIAHSLGSESKEFNSEVEKFFNAIEDLFIQKLYRKRDKTMLIMTADHGHATIDPKTTVYLNKEFPKLQKWIKKNKKGELIVPAGSCRDIFLHIKDEHLEESYYYLQTVLKEKAEVYKVIDLMKQNFFGPYCSTTFRDRVGNLVILPYKTESIWWYEKDKYEITYYSHHGGLTRDEMEIPFVCLSL